MTSVKRRLTPQRERELPEYCAMVRRVIRAHGRRVGQADPEDLAELLTLRLELDTAIATAVQGQRRNGFSWADIGRGLGVTRQAAQMTWGRSSSSSCIVFSTTRPSSRSLGSRTDSSASASSSVSESVPASGAWVERIGVMVDTISHLVQHCN